MPATLFIDLDATLVENNFSRKAIGPLLAEIAAARGEPIETLGREMWQENMRRQNSDPDNVLTMDWDDILETLAARNGVRLSARGIDRWHELAHADDVEVLDEAPQVLRRLKRDGYRIVLATKGLSKYQLPVLEVTGMLALFDDILTPDRTGCLKTSPCYFDTYTQQADGGPFIQIGDHYYDDVICARRNGFMAVLRAPIAALESIDPFERAAQILEHSTDIQTFPKAGTDVRPSAVVISLQELPDLIPQLLERQS